MGGNNPDVTLKQFIQIVDIVGVVPSLRLYKAFSGRQIYFPTIKSLYKIMLDRDLIEELKKKGIKRRRRNNFEIIKEAEKFGLSYSTLYLKIRKMRDIIKDNPKRKVIFL
tara:strand:+ start:15776 stop:16105 length:330 start_codon:yes stop_codon:yes gene_type:complete